VKTRGRPRHPETLTPRQQEVLDLLRQGLTNEEIAQRLGISLDGAKYHVADILRRLQVDSRYEAAQWRPEPARRPWYGALAPSGLLGKLKAKTVGQAAGALLLAVAVVGIGALAWGVFQGSNSSADSGRLLVHASQGAAGDPWDIGVYDAVARREVSSFTIPAVSSTGGRPELAASLDYIFANFVDRVVRYNLDGSGETVVLSAAQGAGGTGPPHIISIALSPDGSNLAVTEQTGDLCPATGEPQGICDPYEDHTKLRVFDAATGDEVMRIDQTDPGFDGFAGQLWRMTWRDDGEAIVVTGATQSEAPGGRAIVTLNGDARTLAEADYGDVSPDGRYVAGGAFTLVCGLGGAIEQHELQVTSAGDGSNVTGVSDVSDNFGFIEWAPDGESLVYRAYALVPDPENGDCPRIDDASIRWYTLGMDGLAPVQVDSLFAAREQWFGDQLVTYTCHGEPVTEPDACESQGSAPAVVEARFQGDLIVSGQNLVVLRVPALMDTSQPEAESPIPTVTTDARPASTPEAATIEGCPVDDGSLCDFAVQLQTALNTGDTVFISSRIAASQRPCRDVIYATGDDVGCPTTDGTSDPIIGLLHMQSDCCSVPAPAFDARLRQWLSENDAGGPWRLYGIVPRATLWQGGPEIILARSGATDSPMIVVGAIDDPASNPQAAFRGVIVGYTAGLFVADDEQLLRWP
jgi:DNA-binding CsgD family transcriptional regulator